MDSYNQKIEMLTERVAVLEKHIKIIEVVANEISHLNKVTEKSRACQKALIFDLSPFKQIISRFDLSGFEYIRCFANNFVVAFSKV